MQIRFNIFFNYTDDLCNTFFLLKQEELEHAIRYQKL